MLNIPTTPKPDSPVFLDLPISQMQTILADNLGWLTHAFGKTQNMSELRDGSINVFPGIHLGSGEFINVLPNQELGNYSFFVIEDPETYDFKLNNYGLVTVRYALVFWFNLYNVIGSDISMGETEAVKAQIMNILVRKPYARKGTFTVDKIYTNYENVFKNYSLKEIENQSLVYPFQGLRFEGDLIFYENC